MKLNISAKRIICFLLAVLMVLSVTGCKDNKKKKKKKVVVRNNIIVNTPEEDDNDQLVSDSNNNGFVEDVTTRAKRALLKKEEEPEAVSFDELHKETFTPEFTSQNVDWAGPNGYVIVYSTAKDKNGASTNARVLAEKLKTFFKDNDNVSLEVYKDTDAALTGNEKMILVGDTAYKKSSLSEKDFAVTLLDNGNLFFEGGHSVMVEKAVDWFRTVKRESGKVATLSGSSDDFTSTLTLDGKNYVYVWGDEFDGSELVDNSKWGIGSHMPQWSDLEYIDTEDVCYVENGRLRMTGIRYLSEDSGDIGWATCGSYDTEKTMAISGGYFEFNAKISYTKGVLAPYWFMSNPEVGLCIPREQYRAPWNIELDFFETFANGDTWDISIHKYYKPYNVTIDGVNYTNGITYKAKDDEGNTINEMYLNGEPMSGKIKWSASQYATYGTITSWRNFYSTEENAKQMYTFEGEELEKLNDSYHKYGLLYTDAGYKVYIDGKCWLERDWDTNWDGGDCYNNGGFGYNLYYYFIMNQHLYTPGSGSRGFDSDLHVDSTTLPISSWVDSVRFYQLSDAINVISPAFAE